MWRSLALMVCLLGDGPSRGLEPIGRLDHPAIREASGIAQSRRHPGIFWVHNDSGNAPMLFAVKRDGSLVREFRVAVPNLDWEDIAIDSEGHLYLGEIGNNNGRLPVRAVYRLDEPDPFQETKAPLKVTLASHYQFGTGPRFDAESLFIERGAAFVIAKYLDGRDAEIFTVALDPSFRLFSPTLPKKLVSLPGFQEPATGADLSPDGRSLAVCSYNVTRVYERGNKGAWSLIGSVPYSQTAIEAICWDGHDLILASEDRRLYRISETVWKNARPRDVGRVPEIKTSTSR